MLDFGRLFTGMAIISGVVGMGGSNRYPVSKRHPKAPPAPNKSPDQSQATPQDKASVRKILGIYAILLNPARGPMHTIYTGFSVFCTTMWKSIFDHLLLFYYCVWIVCI